MLLVIGHMRVRADDVMRLRGPIARQVTAVREFHGCNAYSFGIDLLEPDLLRIAERWENRAAQSAHLVGDHMVDFNLAMRAAKIIDTAIDSYQDGTIRRLMQIPATSFRPERQENAMVVVLGTARFAFGEIERLRPQLEAQLAATRAEDGCQHYAIATDMVEPEVLHISERWRDPAAIAKHLAAPHMTAFNAALAHAKLSSLIVKAYDTNGERILIER